MDKISVLLVDDERNFRQALSKRLKKRAFHIAEAESGRQCLDIMQSEPFDVIVMDVKMPGLSGIETLSEVKKSHPDVEVILLTGHTSADDGVQGIKSGAFDYLSKPVEFDHLIRKIRHAYDKKKREEERKKEKAFRDKMEQQIATAERLASLGTLATGVAHEINNPLAIICESAGWMKVVLEKYESSLEKEADLEKALEKIENAIERAKRITRQLLGIARKSESALAEIDPSEFISETIQLFRKDAEVRGIEIIRESTDNPSLWSDPYQLRQVIINLVTNAIHAIGSSGTIRITTMREGNLISIRIRDSGGGIPGENLDRIFEPFFSTKSPGEGTGLGLFVTRNILERLGGSITVESEIGRGSAFTVSLPLRPSADME